MDAASMYPLGFHQEWTCSYTTLLLLRPSSLGGWLVKYYFVDYGISSYFPSGFQERLFLSTQGRDQNVPELSNKVPHDPLKVDIFTTDNVFHQSFHDVSLCRNKFLVRFPLD